MYKYNNNFQPFCTSEPSVLRMYSTLFRFTKCTVYINGEEVPASIINNFAISRFVWDEIFRGDVPYRGKFSDTFFLDNYIVTSINEIKKRNFLNQPFSFFCFFHFNNEWYSAGGSGQLVPKTTRTQDNSYPRKLVPKTTRTHENSYPGQLVPRTTRVVLGTSFLGYELSIIPGSGQLVPKTTRTQDNSYPWQLVPRTTRTQDNSYLGQLELSWVRVVLGTSCPSSQDLDNSYPRQLVPRTTRTQDNSYPGQLVPKTTRTQDNSYPGQLELSWIRVVLGTSCLGYELSIIPPLVVAWVSNAWRVKKVVKCSQNLA